MRRLSLLAILFLLLHEEIQGLDCPVDRFKCLDGSKCIDKTWFCDKTYDCTDSSDEIVFNSTIHNIPEDGIACRNLLELTEVCLLPKNQTYKEQEICNINSTCTDDQFRCTDGSRCISPSLFCDNVYDCDDDSDEFLFNQSYHTIQDGIPCRNPFPEDSICFLPADQVHKRNNLCYKDSNCTGKDEFACPDGTRCVWKYFLCDENNDCSDGSDEIFYNSSIHSLEDWIPCRSFNSVNDTCLIPKNQAFREPTLCRQEASCGEDYRCLNGNQCIPKRWFCNNSSDCFDDSDEIVFDPETPLSEGIACGKCLMPNKYVCDGTIDCIDGKMIGNDECNCKKTAIFCNGKDECPLGVDECFCGKDQTRSDSLFSDSQCFRCLDDSKIIPVGQLCDGILHCNDMSDECLCKTRPGAMLLPVCNVVSNGGKSECSSNLCNAKTNGNESQCLPRSKVCDGRVDCSSLIDETSCEFSLLDCEVNPENQSSVPACNYVCPYTELDTKKCDGIPRCESLLDECSSFECPGERPKFCDFVLGRKFMFGCPITRSQVFGYQVCDGAAHCSPRDPANSADELYFPNKFYCKNSNPIHIPSSRECDFIEDCSDSSDEFDQDTAGKCQSTHFYCNDSGTMKYISKRTAICDGNEDCASAIDECQDCTEGPFSTDKAMISTEALIPFLWIISIVATFGNLFVIAYMIWKLASMRNQRGAEIERSQNVLVLNLAIGDTFVGIYTLSISIQNVILSAGSQYCREDQNWRSGNVCSSLGAVLMIGSEISVFSLAIITAFRLNTVLRPFSKTYMPAVYISLAISWVMAIIFAVVPLAPTARNYFTERIWYEKNSFMSSIHREYVEDVTKTLLQLRNKTSSFAEENGSIGSWSLLISLIKELNPSYVPAREFGYYSTHGVCLSRLFPDPKNDASWGFSLFLILINFASFLFVFFGYIVILKNATSTKVSTSSTVDRAAALQRKVTRIVITDFLCWMPICIMAFLQISGVNISTQVYVPVGTVLIPINSAINPFLYSDAPEWVWSKLKPVREFARSRTNTVLSSLTGRSTEQNSSVDQTALSNDYATTRLNKKEIGSGADDSK